MSTLSKTIGMELLRNDGWYPGDPQAETIWTYNHVVTKETLFAVYMFPGQRPYGPYCNDIKLLWSKQEGLTPEGRKVLEQNRPEQEL